jgi:hypothetical protein
MKKAVFPAACLIFFVAAGWYMMPLRSRERASAFLAAVLNRDTRELKTVTEKKFLPENPVVRRKELLTTLKDRLGSARRAFEKNKNDSSAFSGAVPLSNLLEKSSPSAEDLIRESEEIVRKLEEANGDQSIAAKTAEKILTAVFPASRRQKENPACDPDIPK